jgi:WD40 repeat protein
MAKVVQASEFFVVGGPVQADRIGYVERAADRALEAALRDRSLVYLLGARGTGKTSLLGRAARALRQSGQLVATVDLAQLPARGEDADVERWTYAIAYRIVHELRLRVDLAGWWRERTAVARETRLADFFWEVVLTNTTAPVTVMFDDIERALELPFGGELLAAIDECYARRAREHDYTRLAFALAGVAAREQLERRDPRHAPAVSIEPADFTPDECYALAIGFGGEQTQTQALMDRIYVWTSGHPYLTQKVARGVARKGGKLEDVERVVRGELLVPAALEEDPFVRMRARLTARNVAARRALKVLRRVARGAKVASPADRTVRNVLLLSGVVSVADGALCYRNRILREALGLRWVKSVAPLGWRTVASAAAIVALAAAAGFAYWNYLPQYYERTLTSPAASAAAVDAAYRGLHRLPGFAARADELLAGALRRRSEDAQNVNALVTTDTALRALPGQGQVADRLLADFWLRKATAAADAEQRDAALLFALRAALAAGNGADEARAWVGELVGDDYRELERTFELAPAPERWGVDWQAGLLLAVEPDRSILRAPLAPRANAVVDAPLRLSVLAPASLERTLRVEGEGSAGELELSVALAHAASAELTLMLTAPSGASATVALPPNAGQGESYVLDARPGTPLAALADEERHGAWRLTLIDRRAGNVGSLVGWGLRFGEQSSRDDPEEAVAIPDPERTTAVEFDVSDDGRFALARPAAPGVIGTLAVWNLGAGKPQADLDLPKAPEHALLNATHTRVLVSAGDLVTLWNAGDGARVARLATQTAFVLPPVFSTDGGYVAIAERVEDAPPLYSLLRAEDGTLLASVEGVMGVERWWLGPGGRYFVLLDHDGALRVLDARRGAELASFPAPRDVAAVLPLPDGATLLTIDGAGDIRAWSVDPKAPAAEGGRPLGTTVDAIGISLSADGSRLAYPTAAGEVVVRAVASGARLASVQIGDSAGARVRLSPDGGRLVTASGKRFRLWSLPSASEPKPSLERAADLEVTALAVDASADRVALGFRDGRLRIGEAADLAHLVAPATDIGYAAHHGAVRALALNAMQGIVASGGDDGVVRLADIASGSPRDVSFARPQEFGDAPIAALALSADGHFVAGAARSSLRVWNAADGTVALDVPFMGHGAVASIAFAPGGEYLAAGAGDGALQVWRRDGAPLGAARALPSAVRWVGFGSDGVLLAATDRWLHSFAVAATGVEPLRSRPAPGSAAAARAFAASGDERVRALGFDARGVLRRRDVDVATPVAATVPPEVLSRDWTVALGLELDDAGEVVSVEH